MPKSKKDARARKATKKSTTTARKRKPATPVVSGARLIPPPGGATVRMYRIGHGDCFLLAFPGKEEATPVYVLIDCGYKPGSPKFLNTTNKEIIDDVRTATGGHIDVAVITHEHQDHVNAITTKNFKNITIGEAWFAWTEDPEDDIAKTLRKNFKDKLLGLLAARNRLAAQGDGDHVRRIDEFLAFELGGESEQFDASAALGMLSAAAKDKDPKDSLNKRSMRIWKDLAKKGPQFIRPHEKVLPLPGANDVRVYALGPPRSLELLSTLDPQGGEEFHVSAFGAGSSGAYFAAAAESATGPSSPEGPFSSRYTLQWDEALTDDKYGEFFTRHYGTDGENPSLPPEPGESPADADWRRIDKDWLYSGEQLALDMNDQTNNASLVLAFELGKGGKVLLFAADAQRGNWLSWSKTDWIDGDKRVTARDLLSRTVLYKVGHHGSHNATLNGHLTDEYANLSWLATGDHAREFCAMITAVRAWAETQKGWDHPLKAIKDALLKKASGRVFQTDTDFAKMGMADGGSKVDWDSFTKRTRGDRLYFDYTVTG
jgi:beta-lactamase superfamily II metal-dependent hydrolase